jgi:hypothetical protein
MRLLQERLRLSPETRVLDVGGTLFNWNFAAVRPRLTFLNLGPRPRDLPPDIEYLDGDARRIDLPDGAFDVVYSNSVIEHLGTLDDQRRMADEVRRVGRRYFVQTPDRAFPVEPHFLTPGVHYLPPAIRRRVLRNFTVWGWIVRPSREQCAEAVREIRLLSAAEMEGLFPDGVLVRERFAGLSKSLIALGPEV